MYKGNKWTKMVEKANKRWGIFYQVMQSNKDFKWHPKKTFLKSC